MSKRKTKLMHSAEEVESKFHIPGDWKPEPPAVQVVEQKPAATQIRQLAVAGLASQGRALSIAECLSDEECRWISETMTPDGKATAETSGACLKAVKNFHERSKAVVDEE